MKLDKKLNKKKSKAQSLIEYALILAMVTVIAVTALQLLGKNMANTMKKSADTINNGTDSVQEATCSTMGGQWDTESQTCKLNKNSDDSPSVD